MNKYYERDLSSFERVKRNQKLYEDLARNVSDLDNLPMPDNVNEIDLNGLKKIINDRENHQKEVEKEITDVENRSIIEKDSDKNVYDINVLLEKAKNTSNKNESRQDNKKANTNFLTDLEEEKIPYHEDTIERGNLENNKEDNDELLPLDILEDLKGNDNTAVTNPIIKEEVTMVKKAKDGETFYSGTFNFTKKDFEEADEDTSSPSSHNVIKMIFFIILFIILLGAIYLILTKYVL